MKKKITTYLKWGRLWVEEQVIVQTYRTKQECVTDCVRGKNAPIRVSVRPVKARKP